MVKFFGLIPRKPGLTSQEFHDHYRHPHGTHGLAIPLLRSYVQSHQIDCALLGPEQATFEAVAETWFDSMDDALAAPTDPYYVKYQVRDEHEFVDMATMTWLVTTEEVVQSGSYRDGPPVDGRLSLMHVERPFTIKLLHFTEAPITRSVEEDRALGARLDAWRHVRCHLHEDFPQDMAPESTQRKPLNAAQELWWPTLTHFQQATADPAAFNDFIASDGQTATMLVQAEVFR